MTNDERLSKEVAPGFTISVGRSGHWIEFAGAGKFGALCVENVAHNISRAAIIEWIEKELDYHRCSRCGAPNPERLELDGCRDPDCPEAGR